MQIATLHITTLFTISHLLCHVISNSKGIVLCCCRYGFVVFDSVASVEKALSATEDHLILNGRYSMYIYHFIESTYLMSVYSNVWMCAGRQSTYTCIHL